MVLVDDLCAFLDRFAPPRLAAEWDNVGLLVGDRAQKAERVMTCLTITPDVAREAVAGQVDLIVTHHPLPFRPFKRLTADVPAGRLLLELIRCGVAIVSPHTAFDSAAEGINQQLAAGLGLTEIQPLEEASGLPGLGSGRFGELATAEPLQAVARRLQKFLRAASVAIIGDQQLPVSRVAIACGSGGDFLDLAVRRGCQVLVTGEARLHTCYEAEAWRMGLLLAGHYASERFGVERLAGVLARQFPDLSIWASRQERDPVAWL